MEMYYVITPVNPQSVGYQFGDYVPAPVADYYTSETEAVAAMAALNEKRGLKDRDSLAEMGAFVIKVVKWAEGGSD